MIYISFILNVLLIILLLYLVLHYKKLTTELKNAQNYNKSLSTLYDGVRGFKHDFDNIINTIGGYIKLKDLNGLQNYYSSLKDECITLNSEVYSISISSIKDKKRFLFVI